MAARSGHSGQRLQALGERNGQAILLLSVRAGLWAKEIAALRWSMALDAAGAVGDAIHLTSEASKSLSGRVIPLLGIHRAGHSVGDA